jgi:hypothetical protein
MAADAAVLGVDQQIHALTGALDETSHADADSALAAVARRACALAQAAVSAVAVERYTTRAA